MREIISPWMVRQKAQSDEQWARAIEDQARLKAERHAKSAAMLAEAFKDIPERTQRMIRMHVALRLPQKPMSAEEAQTWLDEHTLGVVRYMVHGKIT